MLALNKIVIFSILHILFLILSVQVQNKTLTLIESVNELHMLPDSGRSGYPITITFTINNTDQFVAFQFDIILPSVLTFIEDSIWLYRNTDHIIITNQVNQQTLRILAYSPTNQPFSGSEGEIVKIMFNLNGIAGSYNVGLNNLIISNAIGINILTAYYPSYIKIISPDIFGETNIDFGEISVVDTISYDYQLSNTGNDTLIVTDFFSSEIYFWNNTPLPQNIPPYESKIFNLKFHNINKGEYSAIYTIRSNDPDEDPFYVDAVALSFAPNYIIIQNAEAYVRDTVTLKLDVNNFEQFIDFQVDLDFSDSLTYVSNSATLTNRKQDHLLFDELLISNKIRLYTYSPSQLPFLGDSGTVATMNFVVGNDTGTFPLHLSGGILSDLNLQNIIRGTVDGEIYIQKRPTFPLVVTVADGWNMVSVPGINPDGQGVNIWWSDRDPTSSVFKYVNGYEIVNTTATGEGYWMKHIGMNTYNTGDEWPDEGIEIVPHNPINALEGWNLIGGYEDTVQTVEMTTSPPGLIIGPVYGFSDGYISVLELWPGFAYWIKLTGPGQINFPSSFLKQDVIFVDYFNSNWGKITISDADGKSSTLYITKDEVDLKLYELPPKPPSGIFDIRFGNGGIVANLSRGFQSIEMNGIEHPVKVKIEGMDIRLQDETGRQLNEFLKDGKEIEIGNPQIMKLIVSGEYKPDVYALEQNYPNPFNPVTVIEFSLPEDVNNVKLRIYNTLGERVEELVNTSLKAGRYSYRWNASSIATGMYIYELLADEFVSVKKMLLLK